MSQRTDPRSSTESMSSTLPGLWADGRRRKRVAPFGVRGRVEALAYRRPTLPFVMGFNPFRKTQASSADIAMVVGALVLVALALAWGFFG